MAQQLVEHFAALKILIYWRAHHSDVDPISLSRPEAPYYDHRRSNGKYQRYTARLLIEYMLESNNFNEPVSNLPFTDEELIELDSISKKSKWRFPSLLERRHSNVPLQSRVDQEHSQIFESELLELVDQLVLSIVQQQLFMTLEVFNQFQFLYSLYSLHNRRDAEQTLDRCLARFEASAHNNTIQGRYVHRLISSQRAE